MVIESRISRNDMHKQEIRDKLIGIFIHIQNTAQKLQREATLLYYSTGNEIGMEQVSQTQVNLQNSVILYDRSACVFELLEYTCRRYMYM